MIGRLLLDLPFGGASERYGALIILVMFRSYRRPATEAYGRLQRRSMPVASRLRAAASGKRLRLRGCWGGSNDQQCRRLGHPLIRARTGEGCARVVANGVKMGPKLTPHQKRNFVFMERVAGGATLPAKPSGRTGRRISHSIQSGNNTSPPQATG
jgi:hypothetical protein